MEFNCCNCKISIEKFGFENCMRKMLEDDSPYNLDRCKSAAEHGHLECLKKAHIENESLENVCNIAASNGHLECLKYAHENGDKWDVETTAYACESNSLEILRYLHENGCKWNQRVCKNAAEYDHLQCIIYAHENSCPWDEMTLYKAIQNDNVKCLEYAYENGCPSDIKMINEACKSNNIEILKYVHKIMKLPFNKLSCTICVLKGGKLECLIYAHENGSELTENTFSLAIENNLFECIKYLVEKNCFINRLSSFSAVKYSDLECVKYLVKNDIVMLQEITSTYAILNKKICVIKYLIDKGCPWVGMDIMDKIIDNDKLVFLKYF